MEETKVENSCSKDSCSIDTEMKEQVEVELYNDEKQQYEDKQGIRTRTGFSSSSPCGYQRTSKRKSQKQFEGNRDC